MRIRKLSPEKRIRYYAMRTLNYRSFQEERKGNTGKNQNFSSDTPHLKTHKKLRDLVQIP
jgi:hypothetical protein